MFSCFFLNHYFNADVLFTQFLFATNCSRKMRVFVVFLFLSFINAKTTTNATFVIQSGNNTDNSCFLACGLSGWAAGCKEK